MRGLSEDRLSVLSGIWRGVGRDFEILYAQLQLCLGELFMSVFFFFFLWGEGFFFFFPILDLLVSLPSFIGLVSVVRIEKHYVRYCMK